MNSKIVMEGLTFNDVLLIQSNIGNENVRLYP
jgi:hypothetical protein